MMTPGPNGRILSSTPLAKMVPAPTDTTWKSSCDFRNKESPLKRWNYHLKPQSGLWKHIMSRWNRNKEHKSGLFQRDETLERPPRQWWFVPSPPLRATDRKRSPGQEGKGLLCIIVQIWEMFASQLFTWYMYFMIADSSWIEIIAPLKINGDSCLTAGLKPTLFKLMIQEEPFIQ